jgi:hypothetical protein
VGNGSVLGFEIELRKSLKFISSSLENFTWSLNTTLTESSIKMSPSELRSRQLTAREGQTIDDTREMSGQAPYIINTGISYNNYINGWEAGIFYNVQGPTLNLVGFGNRTDTYAVPFNSLNLNLNKSFGADERVKANLGVENILNDKRQIVFRSYEAQDQFFTNLAPGTRIKFGFTFAF